MVIVWSSELSICAGSRKSQALREIARLGDERVTGEIVVAAIATRASRATNLRGFVPGVQITKAAILLPERVALFHGLIRLVDRGSSGSGADTTTASKMVSNAMIHRNSLVSGRIPRCRCSGRRASTLADA